MSDFLKVFLQILIEKDNHLCNINIKPCLLLLTSNIFIYRYCPNNSSPLGTVLVYFPHMIFICPKIQPNHYKSSEASGCTKCFATKYLYLSKEPAKPMHSTGDIRPYQNEISLSSGTLP